MSRIGVPRSPVLQTLTALVPVALALVALALAAPVPAAAADDCCRVASREVDLVWSGTDTEMTFAELAAYCAPTLWFSPDEPNLQGAKGKDIRIPMAFPFEAAAPRPVVYYRVRSLLTRGDGSPAILREDPGRVNTVLDLTRLVGVDLDYFFYYPSEEGFGAHHHDVEAAYMKIYIHECTDCPEHRYAIYIERIIAKAHGILWYDNTLVTDKYTKFPVGLLVEEGKHASCTDKNHDGMYTPTFDVNRRVNDAWGIRDIMRSGGLQSGKFESWMTKIRRPEHRIFPPLPLDSPLRANLETDGEYAKDNAVYELRPFPRPEAAAADPSLVPFIEGKGHHDWPEVDSATELKKLFRWMDEERFVNSLSVSYRYDNASGISLIFPLLIVKNITEPMSGGWLVNRIYLQDHRLRDFGYNVLYTTSASRWFDGYISFGWEWNEDQFGAVTDDPVTETGLKFRFSISTTPLRFLSSLGTDFWGVRFGLKNVGFWEWKSLGYIVEVGAGSF